MHLAAEDFERLSAAVPLSALDHLVTCALCRRRLGAVVSDLLAFEAATDQKRQPLPESIAPLFERVLEQIQMVLTGQAPETSARFEALYQQLLALPAAERTEALANDVRFRSLGLTQPLLAEARSALPEDPLRAQHFAGLVLTLVDRFEDNPRTRRLNALASSLVAGAQRLQGWLDVADDFLRSAAHSLRDEPLVIPERFELSLQAALLRQDQKRADEALSLIEHAAGLAEDLSDFERLGIARLSLGWILVEEDDPGRAVAPLREALAILEAHPDPHLAFSSLHALALAYAELGEDERLSEVTETLEELNPRWTDPLDRVRVRWVILRATWTGMDRERALAAMHEVFGELAENAPAHEAVIAGLELARLIVEATEEDTSQAVAALSRRVRELQLPPHLLAPALFALELAKRRLGAFQDALIAAIRFTERARFNPDYPYWPTPEPETTLRWSEVLPDQLRLAASLQEIPLPNGEPLGIEEQNLLAWTVEAVLGVRVLGKQASPNLQEDDDTTRY